MAIISINEIVDLIILVFALGYIFSGFIRKPRSMLEALTQKRFNWDDLKYAAIIVSPAVIFHELAHKGVGLFFGFDSILQISSFGLGLGVFLRYLGSPIIFFVPAYVTSSVAATHPAQFAILALAGPATNFVLYWVSEGAFLLRKWPKWNHAFMVSKKINLWLFIFNMIPIGIFDGAKVLHGAPITYLSFVVIGGLLIYKNEQRWKKYIKSLA